MHGSAPWKTEETIVGLPRLLVALSFSFSCILQIWWLTWPGGHHGQGVRLCSWFLDGDEKPKTKSDPETVLGEGMHDRKSWIEHRLEELAEIFSGRRGICDPGQSFAPAGAARSGRGPGLVG